MATAYRRRTVDFPIGLDDEIDAARKARGMSIAGFIRHCVKSQIAFARTGKPIPDGAEDYGGDDEG